MPVTGTKQKIASQKSNWFFPLSVIIICIVTLTLYNKSVKNDFLDLDDMTIVVKNYNFLKDFSNAGQAFKQGVFQIQGETDTLTSFYRPMMTLSFMVDAHISPAQSEYPTPGPFLRANIFYHVVACLLLFFLLSVLNIPPLPSLFLTLIFSVHPLLNQAIAWIPGRNDSLLTIFILSSFIFLLKYLEIKKKWLLALHFFFFLLALFTKENSAMFIPLVFFYCYFIAKKKLRKDYIVLGVGYLVCLIPWLIMRHIALISNIDRTTFPFIIETTLKNSPLFIQYISKSVLPFDLSVLTTVSDTNYIIGALAIALLLAGILLSKKKSPLFILFGMCWFLLFLTPSLFSVFSGLEHRAYLPLVGIIFVASQFDILKDPALNNNTNMGKAGIALLSIFFLTFFYISFKRLPIFKNRYTFDQSAMNSSPHALLPCLYLAAHYEQERMYDKAIDTYKEGLRRDSTYDLTYINMAGDYICLNNYKEAEKILKLDLKRNPKNTTATFNLGLIVFQGDSNYSEAVRLWKKAIMLDSDFAQPYKVLSQYYQAMGDSINAALYKRFYFKKRGK